MIVSSYWLSSVILLKEKDPAYKLTIFVDYRVLFTYEGNSNDIRVAGKGGELLL